MALLRTFALIQRHTNDSRLTSSPQCHQVRQERNSAYPELQVSERDGPQETWVPSRLWKGTISSLVSGLDTPEGYKKCTACQELFGAGVSHLMKLLSQAQYCAQEKRKALLDRFYTSFDAQVNC